MNDGQYQQIVRLIAEAGQAEPPGRMYHACFGEGNQLQVFDVWRSKPEWEDFGKFVEQASQQVGVQMGSITVEPVHDIITP
ncbi:MAG TPA: hypothetical protein VH589_05280 [Trebonia sp.]